ncbi:16S rRNA (uracil(1498)-N(3))-methyltransferase [Arenimonas fontis]|uniref:Ribosomal RNA small subunit methyltransferase E n=1 Tax=Arenimonas fontis TaxID=2608255 RepID=A0A5B2Z6S9_9GAMM|nr:16S rRNA (uracil(1498)-N(3))-methyltransferase [Arenimonas fontis]KAA2283669.1 16S rRNA (uracil(1498)-N(3))-methyltransferase [Arenimonas fontis]
MRTVRCHVDLPLRPGQIVALPEPAAAHLVRVLRLGPGDALVLFNGDGHDYPAVLLETGKRGASAEVSGQVPVANESPLRITLAQGIARGDKMDWVLQKATELGVAAIVPVLTERTEVKLDGDRAGKRLAHWRGVLAAACEQCGRARLPTLSAPVPLAQWAASAREPLKLVLEPEGGVALADLPATDAVALAVGPEGGLSARDLEALRAAGFRSLRLGPRVLRTETAGLAAVAALQACWGDF